MFDKFLDDNFNRMQEELIKLISFPSVSEEDDDNVEEPFGINCKNVLNYTLDLAQSMGFKVKNVDNKCGYIEFGEGEEMVGIIGHLDVVPANFEDGWSIDPYKAEIRNGKLFGRGSIDDKGPVIASLFAMKAILDSGEKINKRVRLILGLNEEKNWKCINYYKEHEEHPTIGFSPDANFPAIYAEKGIMTVELKHKFNIQGMDIIDFNCYSNAINVVPKKCSITLKYNSKLFRPNHNFVSEVNELYRNNIEVQNIDEDTIKITSYGVASHASHPEEGINAISNLVQYLNEHTSKSDANEEIYLEKLYGLGFFDIESPEFLARKDIEFATEFEDDSVVHDEPSGILTSNVGYVSYEDGVLTLRTNLRVPVTISLDSIFLRYRQLVRFFEDIEVTNSGIQEPLFVDKDNYLVKTLVDIFKEKSGIDAEPIAIGGGTYARAFKNFVSYGLTMPGDKDMCHQVDEYIKLDDLLLGSKIYAEAIYRLAK